MKKIVGVTVGTPISPSVIKKKLNPVTSVNRRYPNEDGDVKTVFRVIFENVSEFDEDGYATCSPDETYDSIMDAYRGGQCIEGNLDGRLMRLSRYTSSRVVFACADSNKSENHKDCYIYEVEIIRGEEMSSVYRTPLGGQEDGVFYVDMQYRILEDTGYADCDSNKTFTEIKAAYKSGKVIKARVNDRYGNNIILNLVRVDDYLAHFSVTGSQEDAAHSYHDIYDLYVMENGDGVTVGELYVNKDVDTNDVYYVNVTTKAELDENGFTDCITDKTEHSIRMVLESGGVVKARLNGTIDLNLTYHDDRISFVGVVGEEYTDLNNNSIYDLIITGDRVAELYVTELGGSGGVFYVTFTDAGAGDDVLVPDVVFSDILEAHEGGKVIKARYNGSEYDLSFIDEDGATFIGMKITYSTYTEPGCHVIKITYDNTTDEAYIEDATLERARIDLGYFDSYEEVFNRMDKLNKTGKYRLRDDAYIYVLDVERVDDYITQSYWTTDEGYQYVNSRSGEIKPGRIVWSDWAVSGGSGGSGGGLKLIAEQTITTEDEVSLIEFDGLENYDEAMMVVFAPWGGNSDCTATMLINGVQVEKDWYKFQAGNTDNINTFHIKKIDSFLYEVEGYQSQLSTRYGKNICLKGTYYDANDATGILKIAFSLSTPLVTGGYNRSCWVRFYAR